MIEKHFSRRLRTSAARRTRAAKNDFSITPTQSFLSITVTESHIRPFERIPNGYKRILDYLQVNEVKEKMPEGIVACFEYEYDKDGVHYMDIFMAMEAC